MRLPGEFVSGQMISLGTGDSGGVGVHDQVLRLVVCACSVVSCRPYRGRSHNLSSKRAPCYDDSDCRNCSKLHTDKKISPTPVRAGLWRIRIDQEVARKCDDSLPLPV